MRVLLIALLAAISYAQTAPRFYHRRLHIITPECEQCATWEETKQIIEEDLVELHDAFEYHELPFDFSIGNHYSRPWPYPDDGSYPRIHLQHGEPNLWDMCNEWASEYGRREKQYNFDIWYCVMPGPLSKGPSGLAQLGAFQSVMQTRAFYAFKHELGHALGCAHQMDLPCPAGYEEFKIANQINVRTIMAGYSSCPKTLEDGTKLDKVQMDIFTDKDRKYCAANTCFTMGDDNFDCAGDICDTIRKLESYYDCDSTEEIASTIPSCRLKTSTTCKKSTKFGTRHIEPVGCAELILSDNSICPSEVFIYKKGDCQCCPMNYKEKSASNALFKVQHTSATEEMLSFDISLFESNVVRGLALVGVFSLISLTRFIFNNGKYGSIPNDLDCTEN